MASRPPQASASPSSARFAWPRRAGSFVGRQEALGWLRAQLDDHAVVAVHGRPGIGKTELVLQSLADEAAAAGRPAAYLTLEGIGSPGTALAATARALGATAPEIADGARPLEILVGLLGGTPCTLVWDDSPGPAAAPWLVPLVEGLWRWPGPWRLVLVGKEPLACSLSAADLPQLALGPLLPSEVLELLQASGEPLPEGEPAAQERLRILGAGHPGRLRRVLAQGSAMPLGERLLRARLEELEGPARELLGVVAAAGVPVPLEVLAPAVGSPLPGSLIDEGLLERVTPGGVSAVQVPAALAGMGALLVAPSSESAAALTVRIAGGWLVREPHHPAPLLVLARSHLAGGRSADALAVLQAHPQARARAGPAELRTLLLSLAAADPARAAEHRLLLAREQLRWGDFEAALAELDVLDEATLPRRALVHRWRALRATALLRGGDAPRARRELVRAAHALADSPPAGPATSNSAPAEGAEAPALLLGQGELLILQGQLDAARRVLLGVGAAEGAPGDLLARRGVAMALSYLFEQRFDLAAGWARRARLALAEDPSELAEPMVLAVEVLAQLGPGDLARTQELLDRAAPVLARGAGEWRDVETFMRALAAWRAGDHPPLLEFQRDRRRQIEERVGPAVAAILDRFLGLAHVALGQLDRAAAHLQQAETIAAASGFAPLGWLLLQDRAELAEASGDPERARELVATAHQRSPRNPLLEVQVRTGAVAGGAALAAAADLEGTRSPHLVALGQLTAARRALEEAALAPADLALAARLARQAADHYRSRGLDGERALALLALAEAVTRARRPEEARAALQEGHTLANQRGFRLLQIAFDLVGAALAARTGQAEALLVSLERAARRADSADLRDAALDAAVGLAGLEEGGPRAAVPFAPWPALLLRLDLDRPVRALALGGGLTLLRDGDPEPSLDGADRWTLDLAQGQLSGPRTGGAASPRVNLAQQPLLLRLAELMGAAGEAGCTLEELYCGGWRAAEYHALRHRNAVYVAINRLRKSLAPLAAGDPVVKRPDGGYALAAPTWVVAPAPAGGLGSLRIHLPLAASTSALALAVQAHLPVPHACWTIALARTAVAVVAATGPAC